MGSDGGGRAVWVLVANGARLSMIIGVSTMLIAVTIGITRRRAGRLLRRAGRTRS